MARKKNTTVKKTVPNNNQQTPAKRTPAEMREWFNKNRQLFADDTKKRDGMTLYRDVTKASTKTISSFNKETLRLYLQNIASNERNLRNLSRYLYYRSQVYHRLIMYNADMFCLNARSVIPEVSMVEENSPEDIMKSYYETLSVLDHLNLDYELLKARIVAFREDVFYGCVYYDENSMFVLPLDPDYCKISGVFNTGDFAFNMDMTYFRNRQELLEYWGEPFTSMYNESESSGIKWQPMPDEYALCLKARAEDWETVIPVFSGMINSLINLLDLEDIQAIADEQQIYKMIWLELETLSGSDTPDDWKIDPDLVIDYFDRMVGDAIPSYTSAAIVPGKLNTISFDSDQATDTTKIEKATETVLNTSGGAQILNSATISGTTAFEAAILADTRYAISLLLPQIECWVNRFLTYHVSNPAKVKFARESAYTLKTYRKNLLESAQHGLPVKLALNALNGYSEKETMALNFIEEQCLKLSEKFIPMQAGYSIAGSNVGGKESGGQTKDSSDLSDDGEASRDKRDNARG